MTIPLAILLSYLAGSIPTGLWLGLRFRGIDIRKEGSGNIGATNTLRVLGKPFGAVALAVDVFKGWVAVTVFSLLNPWLYLPIICGLAAILGHTFSLFVRFRGGKGVATSAGAFLGLAPMPMLIAGAVFLVIVGITRMVSLGSITAAAVAAVSVFFFPVSGPVRIVAVLVAALIILRHHSNIKRILKREEPRL
ncbi:MAG TPA: glycerol-3-phosphate 1-O-acyltransferase PlsY [Candidatus Hydrogenedentes bacterium]|jgi:glycerol-3-phosphate acyltransferase PlsY|nr:MAG: Glycerol-3-phosphate acyltransferase [Candidatus Hydrogenedentes bacterium ADurb.Bin170]HNZ47478.1 glycerol-3-phosphate 1-O-acyltransferase PlsY [Candidatus Hydrogenedentota bacterium]HOD95405.1 glycerol-3-phosphate 1-O-acyltransferase PlsY [Candidatus Hydrogenedentota bacterium]HOH43179.1 glycerol-3-phosphate 1-O-acyltransferase PlsY [Candidatus Hydrogenedentota bacterium]HOM49520.1 glycerol-3-phosphate 1-O-acyltransferase PlsY [Candidatus Hydrogenedentota bacterium]